MRGAERTFHSIAGCYPSAEVATLLYDPRRTNGRFADRRVRTSFLQPFAADQRRFRRWLPLLPLAAERLSVRDARVVISSSSAFAHGVRPTGGAVHVCYCHSPFRYIWHERDRTTRSIPAPLRSSANAAIGALRRWDLRAASRVTQFVANSEITRRRIAEFYGRDATVVHPPVDINRFTCEPDPQDYVLSVGEVTRHKNTELALAAAERAGITIRVVGEGPDLERLRARYRRAEFLGRVDDRRLAELYAGCRALVVPAVEEFGITMVEALSAGRPVLAAASGGALEIVTDGETGVLVEPRSVDALAEALRATDWEGFDVARLRAAPSASRRAVSASGSWPLSRQRSPIRITSEDHLATVRISQVTLRRSTPSSDWPHDHLDFDLPKWRIESSPISSSKPDTACQTDSKKGPPGERAVASRTGHGVPALQNKLRSAGAGGWRRRPSRARSSSGPPVIRGVGLGQTTLGRRSLSAVATLVRQGIRNRHPSGTRWHQARTFALDGQHIVSCPSHAGDLPSCTWRPGCGAVREALVPAWRRAVGGVEFHHSGGPIDTHPRRWKAVGTGRLVEKDPCFASRTSRARAAERLIQGGRSSTRSSLIRCHAETAGHTKPEVSKRLGRG